MGKRLSKDKKDKKLALQHWLEAVRPLLFRAFIISSKYSFLEGSQVYSMKIEHYFCVSMLECEEKKKRNGESSETFANSYFFPPKIQKKPNKGSHTKEILGGLAMFKIRNLDQYCV